MSVVREILKKKYDPPLDTGIAAAVIALNQANVETFESCEGGKGHAFPEPTVRFHGEKSEGYRAAAALLSAGLPVSELRRVWVLIDGDLTGPHWEVTLTSLACSENSAQDES